MGIRAVGAIGALVGTIILAEFIYYRITQSMTNDAFMESHIVHLAAQEAGVLTRVLVGEHDAIKAARLLTDVDSVARRREVDEAKAERKVAGVT